ncbi:hypothetical protein ABZ656_56935 [Streptomyces sp. NPDC007095]|uniref:hypothetical protein n=1 Tax=Streptomyces sp. NPDC007095 TaxID=3154482 RepID=UPI0026CC7590
MYRIDGAPSVVKIAEVIAESVSSTVHFFQKRVFKTADVRVTVIGSQSFCVRIDSDVLDWRTDYDRLTYTPVEPPPEIEQALHRYLDHFGLVFGTFDFCVGEDGQWWFLECNPSGQWYWLESETGLPRGPCKIEDHPVRWSCREVGGASRFGHGERSAGTVSVIM